MTSDRSTRPPAGRSTSRSKKSDEIEVELTNGDTEAKLKVKINNGLLEVEIEDKTAKPGSNIEEESRCRAPGLLFERNEEFDETEQWAQSWGELPSALPAYSPTREREGSCEMRRLLLFVAALALISIPVAGSARQQPGVIVLPGARNQPKGSQSEPGPLFTRERSSPEPSSGATWVAAMSTSSSTLRRAGRHSGLKADLSNDLLFVAGGFTGQAYVYDLSTGAPVADFQLGDFPKRCGRDQGRGMVHGLSSSEPLLHSGRTRRCR